MAEDFTPVVVSPGTYKAVFASSTAEDELTLPMNLDFDEVNEEPVDEAPHEQEVQDNLTEQVLLTV
jgi:hypothetical protein